MKSTVDLREVEHFSSYAEEWWNFHGPFKALHALNPARLLYIKDSIKKHFNIDMADLNDIEILDIGCGGGLLSEPLARLDAKVTAIDASEKNILIAKEHALKSNLSIEYIHTTAESFCESVEKKFKIILLMDLIEHIAIDKLDDLFQACNLMLEDDGIIVTSTINRNIMSYLLAIIAAENILRWAPKNSHNFNKFIKPSELMKILDKNGFILSDISGICYSPIKNAWYLNRQNVNINYISYSVKICK